MTHSRSKTAPTTDCTEFLESTVPRSVMTYDVLPFFSEAPVRKGRLARRNFWAVSPSGDYARDCETGEKYALMFLEAEEEASPDCGTLLTWVISDMPRGELQTGIEVAFLELIGHAAVGGADYARKIVLGREQASRRKSCRKKSPPLAASVEQTSTENTSTAPYAVSGDLPATDIFERGKPKARLHLRKVEC